MGISPERAARDQADQVYYVPESMTYREWEKAFANNQSDLQIVGSESTIESQKETIQNLEKLKQSGISDSEYNEYIEIISSHKNPDITKLYRLHADEIVTVTKAAGGEYSLADNTLVFDFPSYEDMNKYGTLAHEYGHFFDQRVEYEGIHFNEIQAVQKATELKLSDHLSRRFRKAASSSDEFLAAIRKDKDHISEIYTKDIKADLFAHNASSGVQDAIDGLFPNSRINWGHGEKYYNRKYAAIESWNKISPEDKVPKKLQQVYKDLGLDASNQAKVKAICRQYEAASEAWANIMSAEVCGGESLEYVKKYLPNSYSVMLEILKGAK